MRKLILTNIDLRTEAELQIVVSRVLITGELYGRGLPRPRAEIRFLVVASNMGDGNEWTGEQEKQELIEIKSAVSTVLISITNCRW